MCDNGVELFFAGIRIVTIQFLLQDAEQVGCRREFNVEIGYSPEEGVGPRPIRWRLGRCGDTIETPTFDLRRATVEDMASSWGRC